MQSVNDPQFKPIASGGKMKKLQIMLALITLASIGAIGSSDAHAGPIIWHIDPDSGAVVSGVNSSSILKGPEFVSKGVGPAFFSVTVQSNGAGNGSLTDSLIVALQKFCDLGGDTQKWPDSTNGSWMSVLALPAMDPTIHAGKQRFMSPDSVRLGFFPLGGRMRIVLYKGGGQTNDTINGDYSLDAVYEESGKE